MRFRPDRRNRPRRRGIIGGVIAAALAGRLTEANRLFEAGSPKEAAQEFAQLAKDAEQRGEPKRAAQLHLRAGEAFAQAGDGPNALAEARAALALIRSLGRDRRAGKLGWRIVDGLRSVGLNAEAETLHRELTGVVGAPEPEAPAAPARGRLPTHCPQCGGPLRSDEVEWIDAHSAECAYCGGVVQAP